VSEPGNVGSIVGTALGGARARLQWIAEGEVGREETEMLLDLIEDLETWEPRHGPALSRFTFVRPEDLLR
jgi:hypothetical protein